jgi:hypothetical protein
MDANPGGPLQLPLLTAAFGCSATTTITVSNPLGVAASFTAAVRSEGDPSASNNDSSKKACFEVSPSSFNLSGYASREVVLKYKPTKLGGLEQAAVIIGSSTAGSVEYEAQGMVSACVVSEEGASWSSVPSPMFVGFCCSCVEVSLAWALDLAPLF